jgi:D-alanine-D-alanine ligase
MVKQEHTFQKVAVLTGGIGTEREISLLSGQNVYQALQKTGLEVVFFDITPDHMSILDDESIDIFFLILHGQFGEDGRLQAVLEKRNLCFTGSGSKASQQAMDKVLSKKLFARAGVAVPKCYASFDQFMDGGQLNHCLPAADGKWVVKPIRHGSSVGVRITDTREKTITAAKDCFETYHECMIEEYILGREFTVGILNQEALPILEIHSQEEFYDYHAKYVSDKTKYLFDTIEDRNLIKKLQQQAQACFLSLQCRHWGRVDFIVNPEGIPYVLEVNTLPGFTSHSLLPMAAAKTGLSADQLCLKILQAAWQDFQPKTRRKAK